MLASPMATLQSNRSSGSPALHYMEGSKNGPPLVLLHGLGRCWEDFAALIPSLLPHWHLFALDHAGHGQSERRPEGYLVRDYVTDTSRFLEDEIPHGAVLHGHSLGAMVALAVAAQRPDLVARVILEDPPFNTMGSRIAETPWQSLFVGFREIARRGDGLERTAAALGQIPVCTAVGMTTLGRIRSSEAIQFSARCLAMVDPEIFTPVIAGRWLEGFDEGALFREVTCPVLLLQGDPQCGAALTDLDADAAQTACTRLRRINFPNTSHLIHHEQPEAVLTAIDEFTSNLL